MRKLTTSLASVLLIGSLQTNSLASISNDSYYNYTKQKNSWRIPAGSKDGLWTFLIIKDEKGRVSYFKDVNGDNKVDFVGRGTYNDGILEYTFEVPFKEGIFSSNDLKDLWKIYCLHQEAKA